MEKLKPLIVINLKTYQHGEDSVEMAKSIDAASRIGRGNLIVAAQASDIYEINKLTNLRIYSEHVDPYAPGKHTGYIVAESVRDDGAVGTLLNHSEHKIDFKTLKKTVKRCNVAKLETIICAASLEEAEEIIKLKPLGIAFEVPELIGTGKSISKARPKSVKKFAEMVKAYNKKNKTNIKILAGAGISTKEDIESAIKLGCEGVLISSVITKAKNPEEELRKLLEGWS